MENNKLKKFIATTIKEYLNESVHGNNIYHFTESLDSLLSILDSNTLESGSFNGRFGRGYDNISFTWNPNLWNIEYLGDEDARYKVRIALDYQRMSQKYEFKEFDYGIPEEEEEIIEADDITPIIPYITEILISTEESMLETNNLKKRFPNLKIKRVKRRG